jgi:hypothetical protein
MKYFLLLLAGLMSCLSPLEKEIKAVDNPLVEFTYLDDAHMLLTAKRAVWFAAWERDTLVLNPGEAVILIVPDDEYTVSVGDSTETFEITF